MSQPVQRSGAESTDAHGVKGQDSDSNAVGAGFPGRGLTAPRGRVNLQVLVLPCRCWGPVHRWTERLKVREGALTALRLSARAGSIGGTEGAACLFPEPRAARLQPSISASPSVAFPLSCGSNLLSSLL